MSRSTSAGENDVVHRLMREIIDLRRVAADHEVEQIIQHIARAPFTSQEMKVPAELHGVEYIGQKLGFTADSLTVHLVNRVLVDRQWRVGTTSAEFLSDIRAGVDHPSARLILYRRRGGHIAAVLSSNPVPMARRGDRSMPLLFIVYAIQRGSIISAYQASDVDQIAIPGDALWLR